MMRADEFAEILRKGKKKGESLGRTKLIVAALEAYWESRDNQQADAEQASYLYQVIKLCKWWFNGRAGAPTSTTEATRRFTIERLLDEANQQLMLYPIVYNALMVYDKHKAGGAKAATPLKNAYAHEGAAYQQAKAQGQFYDPHLPRDVAAKYAAPRNMPNAPREAPSATLIEGKRSPLPNTPLARKPWQQLTFTDYMRLDALLNKQYKVLYLSKFQRLQYMVPVDHGHFWRPMDGKPYDMPGSRVTDDVVAAAKAYMYACDRYGSLFVMRNDMRDSNGNYVQLNHSTLVGGRDVICAGTISIKGGRLRGISNKSGHYTPSTQELTEFLKLLRDDGGVKMDASVLVIDQATQCFTTADRFLRGDYQDLGFNSPEVRTLFNVTA